MPIKFKNDNTSIPILSFPEPQTEPVRPLNTTMADTVVRPDEPENAGYVTSPRWLLAPGSLPHNVRGKYHADRTCPISTIELKENTVIVVLGASGDLAKKKTFPALFGLVGEDNNGEIGMKPLLTLLSTIVPQQIPPQGHQDRGICQNKDGPCGIPQTSQILHKDPNKRGGGTA